MAKKKGNYISCIFLCKCIGTAVFLAECLAGIRVPLKGCHRDAEEKSCVFLLMVPFCGSLTGWFYLSPFSWNFSLVYTLQCLFIHFSSLELVIILVHFVPMYYVLIFTWVTIYQTKVSAFVFSLLATGCFFSSIQKERYDYTFLATFSFSSSSSLHKKFI